MTDPLPIRLCTMKSYLSAAVLSFSLLALLCAAGPLGGAESGQSAGKSGYTVTLDLAVGETGAVENATVSESGNKILDEIARDAALKMTRPVRSENGAPVKYHESAPLFFPVQGDGGAEAQQGPLPVLRISFSPTYPPKMLESKTTGGAILQLRVGSKGEVKEVLVLQSSHESFGEAAVQAARKWKFRPAMQDGAAVEMVVHQAVAFKLTRRLIEWKWYAAPRPCLTPLEVEPPTSDANAR